MLLYVTLIMSMDASEAKLLITAAENKGASVKNLQQKIVYLLFCFLYYRLRQQSCTDHPKPAKCLQSLDLLCSP
jgi:hypothetical protein